MENEPGNEPEEQLESPEARGNSWIDIKKQEVRTAFQSVFTTKGENLSPVMVVAGKLGGALTAAASLATMDRSNTLESQALSALVFSLGVGAGLAFCKNSRKAIENEKLSNISEQGGEE